MHCIAHSFYLGREIPLEDTEMVKIRERRKMSHHSLFSIVIVQRS